MKAVHVRAIPAFAFLVLPCLAGLYATQAFLLPSLPSWSLQPQNSRTLAKISDAEQFNKLRIENLSVKTSLQVLRDWVSTFGEIIDCNVVLDAETAVPSAVAFVTFESESEASAACKALNGAELSGRKLIVNPDRERKPSRCVRDFCMRIAIRHCFCSDGGLVSSGRTQEANSQPVSARPTNAAQSQIEAELRRVDDEISRVERQIEDVEAKLSTVETKIEIDTARFDYWAQEKTELRQKKSQLRDKESQFRDKESQLRVQLQAVLQLPQPPTSELSKPPTTQETKKVGTLEWVQQSPFYVSSRPKPEDCVAPTLPDLPRVGREAELHNIWNGIFVYFTEKLNVLRRPLYFFQASPGVGKSRLLMELLKRKPQDVPDNLADWASNVQFFVVDFNGRTQTCREEPLESFAPIYLRLLYTECWDKRNSYRSFIDGVNRETTISELSSGVWSFLRTRIPENSSVVILVDELSKADTYQEKSNQNPNSVEYRRFLCEMQETMNIMVIFTALQRNLMLAEKTLSGRPVLALTKLPLLSTKDVESLLSRETLQEPLDHLGKPVPRTSFISTMARLTGGHARTVESVVLVLRAGTSYNRPILQHCIESLTTSINLWSSFSHVMKPCILAEPVNLEDTVPGSEETYQSMVGSGQLISSLTERSVKMIPFIPPLFVYLWLSWEENFIDPLYQPIKALVKSLEFWGPANVDVFHARWEVLIRLCRSVGNQRYPTLLQLYKEPQASLDRPLLTVPVADSSHRTLKYFSKNNSEILSLDPNAQFEHVWVPVEPNNPGFDVLLFYRRADGKPLPVFVECKFPQNKRPGVDGTSVGSSMRVLDASKFIGKHNLCSKFASKVLMTDEFVVVFICLAEIAPAAIKAAPENCMFIDSKSSMNLYGPTLGGLLFAVWTGADKVTDVE